MRRKVAASANRREAANCIEWLAVNISPLWSLERGFDEHDFIHTENMVLVDEKKRVRGFYDGTNDLEIDRLIGDIQVLLDRPQFSLMAAVESCGCSDAGDSIGSSIGMECGTISISAELLPTFQVVG